MVPNVLFWCARNGEPGTSNARVRAIGAPTAGTEAAIHAAVPRSPFATSVLEHTV
jgi:hypothetical protein